VAIEANAANEVGKADEANQFDEANEAHEANENKVDNFCVAKANVANEANDVFIEAKGSSVAGNIFEPKEANKPPLFFSGRILCVLLLLLPLSLTKYSAIFEK
jgi:hypothetical protein